MVGEWDFDSITSRFADEGAQEAYVRGLKRLTTQAGGRRRPVHLGRHDGADGARRRARHDRLRAPLDRRPVPARGRSRRGAGRTSASASAATSASPATYIDDSAALHPEPDAWARSGGAAGIPSGSAPKTQRSAGAGGRRRPVRTGGRAGARQARLRGGARRGNGRAGRPGRCARRGCRGSRRGSACSTTAAAARAAGQRRAWHSDSELTADEIASYEFDHVAIATGARWRADGVGRWHAQPDRDRRRRAGAHARRPDGRAHGPAGSASSCSTTTTTTWAACSPSCSPRRGSP